MFGGTKKFINGDGVPKDREFLNSVFDAGVAAKLQNRLFEPNESEGETPSRNSNEITIQNKLSENAELFGIVKIGSPVVPLDDATFHTRQVFEGVAPVAGDDFAILQSALAQDAFAPAVVSGLSPVKINMIDASHKYAVCTTDKTKLKSATSGQVKIISVESGTGDKWALVKFISDERPVSGMVRATADIDFDETNTTFDVTVTFSNVAGIDATDTLTVNNHLGFDGDINAKCYVWVHGDTSNNYDLIAAECPA